MELFEISEHTIAAEPPPIRVWVGPVSGLLNGGLIAGSVTLLYGREGVGKSTLALGMAHAAAESVPALYATAEDEMDRRSILQLAGRTGVTHVFRGASVASVDEVIAAATQTSAQLVIVDSLPAVTALGSSQAAALGKLRAFARQNDVAVVALVMLDTANRPAGGYRLLYGADTIIECSVVQQQPVVRLMITRDSEPMLPFDNQDDDDRTIQPEDDPDDTSLRRIKVSKSRGGPSVSVVMRMTSSGLEPHAGQVDAAIAAALTVEADAESMPLEREDPREQW
ncbi:AAA family ATPase [Mycolicibacterium fortuitum]|uniref:AAA family ATPase n=1 Tax=Mycolicibacterium fortuitum TaxID=1766 RepID=UPI0014902870|nr:AAA family ATPase [Mycolicibacterium fortuitum]